MKKEQLVQVTMCDGGGELHQAFDSANYPAGKHQVGSMKEEDDSVPVSPPVKSYFIGDCGVTSQTLKSLHSLF